MTTSEPDEAADDLPWPAEADPVGAAISALIAHIFEALPIDCPERRVALVTVIECHTRIAELIRRPRLN